jgi:ABC-type glycerol-3-phosphate transport system substrate-binding protein
MKKLFSVLVLAATTLMAAAVAFGAKPPATTFVAVLTSDEEVPLCAEATGAARGNFVAMVVDEASGTVEWMLTANNLPGDIVAAHIHLAPKGVAGPVVQPLPPTPGAENGVIGSGIFSNPALVAAMQADPDGYYVNVHTNVCQPGVIRGQLGDRGPSNN